VNYAERTRGHQTKRRNSFVTSLANVWTKYSYTDGESLPIDYDLITKILTAFCNPRPVPVLYNRTLTDETLSERTGNDPKISEIQALFVSLTGFSIAWQLHHDVEPH
jgi:hypothetical protein